jgi:hypothetical protein
MTAKRKPSKNTEREDATERLFRWSKESETKANQGDLLGERVL